MSRRDRRHAKQEVKKFTPKKKNALNTWVIAALGALAVVFFVGTMLIQRG
ncbi:MAG: hypothetical protein MJY93_03170 [Fibrobacter sp.]|nr:hypothetical protein [Fibrobacter sp.]